MLYNLYEISLYAYCLSIICEDFDYKFDSVIITTKNNTKIVYSLKCLNKINFLYRKNFISAKYTKRYIKDILITVENKHDFKNYSLKDLKEFIDISEM